MTRLSTIVDHVLESERRANPPTPAAAESVIRALLAAITNLERAEERHRRAEPGDTASHLRGCRARLVAAKFNAEQYLKPSTC